MGQATIPAGAGRHSALVILTKWQGIWVGTSAGHGFAVAKSPVVFQKFRAHVDDLELRPLASSAAEPGFPDGYQRSSDPLILVRGFDRQKTHVSAVFTELEIDAADERLVLLKQQDLSGREQISAFRRTDPFPVVDEVLDSIRCVDQPSERINVCDGGFMHRQRCAFSVQRRSAHGDDAVNASGGSNLQSCTPSGRLHRFARNYDAGRVAADRSAPTRPDRRVLTTSTGTPATPREQHHDSPPTRPSRK